MLQFFRLSRHSSLSDGGPPRAPDDKLGIYDLPSSLIHIFEIASNIMRLIIIAKTKK
jgi:hypothetical protein